MRLTRVMAMTSMVLATLLTSCADKPQNVTTGSKLSEQTLNQIALCSGGLDSELGLKIQGAYTANGGSLTAGVKQSIAGFILADPSIPASDKLAVTKVYTECLEKQDVKAKVSAVNACRAKLQCEIDTLQMSCGCRHTVEEVAKEKSWNEAQKSAALKKECFSGQSDLRRCYPNREITGARAECSTLLDSAGVSQPEPAMGTCMKPAG